MSARLLPSALWAVWAPWPVPCSSRLSVLTGGGRVLPDGSLGLIDYGMVGRLTLKERLYVARVIVALAAGNTNEVRVFFPSILHIFLF